MLTMTNLKVAIECAYQAQYDDKDFDGWILGKIRDEIISLNKHVRETHDKM